MNNSQRKELLNYLLSESHLIDTSDQYLESVLTEYGYDAGELKAEGNDLVAKLFLKAKAQLAKKELLEIINSAKEKLLSLKQADDIVISRIQELFDQKYSARYSLNFRDLKQMSEKDALSILSDLEILDFLDKLDGTSDKAK